MTRRASWMLVAFITMIVLLTGFEAAADAADQADLIQSAGVTVDERRQQLGQVIDPVAAAQR